MITLSRQDISDIAQMAEHYDKVKFDIATNEALKFDLEVIFGTFIDEIETNWNSVDAKWTNLIGGSTFTKGGKTIKHYGLKDVLKYYAYSRYLLINGFNDTPNGSVSKSNPFSVPKPLKEVESYSLKYRAMGRQLLSNTLEFICENRADYPVFQTDACKSCAEVSDRVNTTTTGAGFNSKTISKWDA